MEHLTLNVNKCKATGKRTFRSRGEAKENMLRIKGKKNAFDKITRKKLKRRAGKPAVCRYYHCPYCKGFHLTSSQAGLTQDQIQKKFVERIKSTEGLVKTYEEAAGWKADGLPFPNN